MEMLVGKSWNIIYKNLYMEVCGKIIELNGGFSARNCGRGHAILAMVSQVPVPMEGWEHVVIT